MQSSENAISFLHITTLMVLVGILLMGVLSSCQKDDEVYVDEVPQIEEEPCIPIPYWNGLGFRPTVGDSVYFTNPVVNPNNPDEIIFLKNREYTVYKLNYVTGEKNVVIEDAMGFTNADWGVNDWILFTRMQNLYKVKSNGDSLTQITFNGVGRYGVWNPSGDKYLYTTSSAGTGLITVVSNMQDVIIDTLPAVLHSFVDWYSDSTIYWALGYYNLGMDTSVRLLDLGIAYAVAGLSAEESIHLSPEGGMKRLNKVTGEIFELQPPYPNCTYYVSGINYSPQKNKLLAQRVYRELMSDGIHEYFRYDIVWLNLDGTVHEVIDITQFMDE